MVVRFEPIAAKLRSIVSLPLLLPLSKPAELLLGLHAEQGDPEEPPVPEEVHAFWSHYCAVTHAALALLEAPPFASLARRCDQQEEEYMSGGPPMSPLYHSYSVLHMIAEVPQGVADETPASVIAHLTAGRAGYETLHAVACEIAKSHLDLYRVQELTDVGAKLVAVRRGTPVAVRISGPFLRDGDLFLGRVVRHVDGMHYIVDSPYLLRASEAEWLAYFGRVAGVRSAAASGSAPAPSSGKARAKDKKGKKEKRRKRDKARAAGSGASPDDVVLRHLKNGTNWRTWPEFITEGYSGERGGIVYLSGVPDRPETLPHNDAYAGEPIDDGSDDDESPERRLRGKLLVAAQRDGTLREVLRMVGGPDRFASIDDVPGFAQNLLLGASILGPFRVDGTSQLEAYAQSRDVPEDERRVIEALQQGWFSIFEVRRVELNVGLHVMDVLRRKRLFFRERLATRSVDVGSHLAAWIVPGDGDEWILEGAVMELPRLAAQAIVERTRFARDDARARFAGLDAKRLLGVLAPIVIGAVLEFLDDPALPQLHNTSGDEWVESKTRFSVRDPARVSRVLSAELEADGDDEYVWFDENETLLAQLRFTGDALHVETNSRERLVACKQKLQSLLGDAVTAGLDSFEGEVGLREKLSERKKPPRQPELPVEALEGMLKMLADRMRATLDDPIPKFGDKTLRQLARGKQTRDHAVSWLRTQERIFRGNPQLDGFDMRPLWEELGLPYQGLEADQ